MKQFLIAILCFFMLTSISSSRMTTMIVGGGAPAAGGSSCPGDATELVGHSDIDTDLQPVGYESAEIYIGQGNFDPGDVDITICSVDVYMHITNGSGNTIHVEIFEMSGTALGSSPSGDCVSDSIVMTTANDDQVLSFGGMSCLLDNTKLYGITVARTDHSYDATNFSRVYVGDVGTWSGQYQKWNVSKVSDGTRNLDMAMDLNGF